MALSHPRLQPSAPKMPNVALDSTVRLVSTAAAELQSPPPLPLVSNRCALIYSARSQLWLVAFCIIFAPFIQPFNPARTYLQNVGRQVGLPTFYVDDPACLSTLSVGNTGLPTSILGGVTAASSRWVRKLKGRSLFWKFKAEYSLRVPSLSQVDAQSTLVTAESEPT